MKNLYLIGSVVILVIIIIPFFEGLTTGSSMLFLGETWNFTSIYPILILFGMLEGMCLLLYFQSLASDIKSKSENAFDL